MSTFVLVHGAWHGGSCWEEVAGRLMTKGHDVLAPTLAGFAERGGELHARHRLSNHAMEVADLLGTIGPLSDAVIVGHSYCGLASVRPSTAPPETPGCSCSSTGGPARTARASSRWHRIGSLTGCAAPRATDGACHRPRARPSAPRIRR